MLDELRSFYLVRFSLYQIAALQVQGAWREFCQAKYMRMPSKAKATPEEFQLDVGGDCMGWDRAKLYKRLGREPSAPPAKSQKGDAEASPSPPSPATPKWSQAEVDAMTVPKLKAALTELGLATDGLKAVLKARLVEQLGL